MSIDPNTSDTVDFPHVFNNELLNIKKRREMLRDERLPFLNCEPGPLAGLALSGGGIRSACFNLGLIEAFDSQAVPIPKQLNGQKPALPTGNECGNHGQGGKTNGQHHPDATPPNLESEKNGDEQAHSPQRDEDEVRYLELFDYLSTVSGGSYVASHLAMATLPSAKHTYDGIPHETRLGELAFDTNSVPQWSWAVGVWFLGFIFQLLKTGSILIAILATVAFIFRTCDALDVDRFYYALGLDTDVRRGFVPFWITLGVTFILYLFRRNPRRALAWGTASFISSILYSISIFAFFRLNQRTPFIFHFLWLGLPLFAVLVIDSASRTRHIFNKRWFWITAVTTAALVTLTPIGPYLLRVLNPLSSSIESSFEKLGLDAGVRNCLMPFWIILGVILSALWAWRNPQTFFNDRRHRGVWISIAAIAVVAVYGVAVIRSYSIGHPAPLLAHVLFSVVPFCFLCALILISKASLDSEFAGGADFLKMSYLFPLLTALFCFAGLVTTGDIDVKAQTTNAPEWTQWGQHIFMIATGALGVTSLAFVRWQDLLRSTHQVVGQSASKRWRPIFQVVIFLCSYGLLLLLSFVLYGMIACEDVSGYSKSRLSISGSDGGSDNSDNSTSKMIPATIFHWTDFVDWDKAWTRIHHDAALKNSVSPWDPLAGMLLKTRETPDASEDISLAYELAIDQQIKALEARPRLSRFLPESWLAYLGRRPLPPIPNATHKFSTWPSAAYLYELRLELIRIRQVVARRIESEVLGQVDLYQKLLNVPETAVAATKPLTKPSSNPLDEAITPRDAYFRTARHLASLSTDDNPLHAAVRQNNRRALRLYLGDLARDGDAETREVFASIVWYEDQCTRLRILAIALGIWILTVCIDRDSNKFSLHYFYHDHIRKQWLRCDRGPDGTGLLWEGQLGLYRSDRLRPEPVPKSPTLQDGDSNHVVLRRAPFFLINATISEGSRSLGNDPNLCLNIFTFSPIAVGSPASGYWIDPPDTAASPDTIIPPAHSITSNVDFVRKNRLDIGQMAAISGAFLSPGQVANPTLAAIFHILNIQTGWWVSDPAVRDGRWQWLKFHFWQSLGVDAKNDNHYMLTDGAHVENLGLKVLLDRRCSLIVASDCSQDSDLGHPFGALIEVIRQARLDKIRVGPFLSTRGYLHWMIERKIDKTALDEAGKDCLRPQWQGLDLVDTPAARQDKKKADQSKKKENQDTKAPDGSTPPAEGTPTSSDGTPTDPRLAQEHFLFAHIEYPPVAPDKPAEEGLLIYLRPTLTGDEGESLVRPGLAGEFFPNDPPLDQFYNVARMNSYRLLGRHIGHALTRNQVFSEAMTRIVRGKSAAPEKPVPKSHTDYSCFDCRKNGSGACQAHLDADFLAMSPP